MIQPTALYRHFDAAGQLLYVGISLSPVYRLGQHIDGSSWANSIASITLQWFDSREEAHAAERQAIRDENPKHNLIRYPTKLLVTDDVNAVEEPVVDDMIAAIEAQAERSRYELLRATVSYRPIYTVEQASDAVGIPEPTLKWWIGEGECGHVVLGSSIRPHRTSGVPYLYRRIGITGWQLIDLVELLQRQSATGEKLLSDRPAYAPRRALFAEPADGSGLPVNDEVPA